MLFRSVMPPPQRGNMGLMVLRCADMAEIASRYGHSFADLIRQNLAKALLEHCPQGTPVARCAEDEFALLVREATTRTACERLAATLLHGLKNFGCQESLTKQALRPRLNLGYAVYPQDIEGDFFLQPLAEQAALLLAKARLAARVAEERGGDSNEHDKQEQCMAFANIVHEGGIISELLPLSRMLVSLGHDVGAQPGLRFSIWSPLDHKASNPRCKGELGLLEVDNNVSLAELTHLDDPAKMPEVGDSLRLILEAPRLDDWLGEEAFALPNKHKQEQTRPPDGLLAPQDFNTRLASTEEAFCLVMLRLAPGKKHTLLEPKFLARINAVCQSLAQPDYGMRQGAHNLLFVHAEANTEKIAERYALVLKKLAAKHILAAAGLTPFPFLHFQRGELAACCIKALELAKLLPAPHVGIFGSLALHISADRHYSKGELFKAIEEYEWALLADKNNAEAWNSLGVCMAALAHHHEAQRYFSEALKRKPDDSMTLYNLGVVCQNLGKTRLAARHFKSCLKHNPEHVFAHIRLGRLAAEAGHLAQARRCFMQATKSGSGAGLAHRLLARLDLRQNKTEEAREHLHCALQYNPQDARALHMLAKLYMDCGEDPAVAEMLARQSAALMPELALAWQELGRALKAQGRETEAAAARARAART